jgi:hypothetical protein
MQFCLRSTDVSGESALSLVRVEESTQEMETSNSPKMSVLVWWRKTTALKMSEFIYQLITVSLQTIDLLVTDVGTSYIFCLIHIVPFCV